MAGEGGIIVCKFGGLGTEAGVGPGYGRTVCFCEEDIVFERTQGRKWDAD